MPPENRVGRRNRSFSDRDWIPSRPNQQVDTLHRASLEILAAFGRGGRSAGQFHWVHNLAVDSRGDIYTAEVDTGKRAQKFKRTGSIGCEG